MKVVVAIPARLGSVRLSKKVLADLCGKPVIQHVYEASKKANVTNDVIVLVDDDEVASVVQSFGGKAIMTSKDCPCGTARVASAIDQIDADFVINVQGDEPLFDPKTLSLISEFAETTCYDMITPIFKITDALDLDNPARVKVVLGHDGRAMYFSRSPIPFVRDIEKSQWLKHSQFWGHIGIYGYRRKVLENYKKLPESKLERAEFLEQLRLLEGGYSVGTVVVDRSTIGIDTAADLANAAAYIRDLSK